MRLEQLRRTREQILGIADEFGVRNIRVFGSVARGPESDTSDIDLLVDLDPNRTLMDLGGLLVELERALGCPVDVSTPGMMRPHVREQALRDAVPL